MKAKSILTAIFPVILTGLFFSMAEAQLCGTFGLKITVTDQSGNAVEGVTVRLEPDVIQKTRKLLQDAKDRKVFQIIIQEGDQPSGSYELQVGAPGFETFRQEVSFPHCKRQALEVRLRRLPAERLKSATALPVQAAPLVIGETFTLDSGILGETRRINVYLPPGYAKSREMRVPVLYMPDGGMDEDFPHVAGLVQVLVGNGTMRPFLLVGIENTQRRRDLTGLTENPEDKKITPRVGGSREFRAFLRDELMPQVKRRYRTTDETAIVGESLAGLFVVETFLLEPELFDTYFAFDPSLWWNNQRLVNGAGEQLRARPGLKKTLYFASSDEKGIAEITDGFAEILRKNAPSGLHWHYEKMPEEKHSTIYHPAALKAFRALFKPAAPSGRE